MKPKKRRKDSRLMLVLMAALGVVALAAASLLSSSGLPQPQSPGYNGATSKWNCADMQIDVTSVKEASAYFRYGLQRNAPPGYVFQMLAMTVTNKAGMTQDFSGYRMELSAGGRTYIPSIFNNVEKIIPVGGAATDLSCSELALASISRLVLDSGQSSSGCKIFQVLQDAQPTSLAIYDTTGLKCTIQL